jgi:hypothetical protein
MLCVRAELRTNTPLTVALTFPGTHLLAGSSAEVAIDPNRAEVRLALDPAPHPPQILWVEDGATVVGAVASVDDPDVSPEGLVLQLADERTILGSGTTDARGAAKIVIPEGRLGAPGAGTLHLTFAGDAKHTKAARDIPCERRARVVVAAVETDARGNARADEVEDGIKVDIAVRTVGGLSVPTGSVEGLSLGTVVGAAPVEAGRARLTIPATVNAGGGEATPLTVRYVPAVPWYVAGSPAVLSLGPPHTLFARRILVVAVGLALFAWFFLSRSRFLALIQAGVARAGRSEPDSKPPIEVVEAHKDARTTWEGVVRDAHEGTVLSGATVALERHAFGRTEVLATTTSDPSGGFVLHAPRAEAGDHLAVEAPLHSRVTQPAPPFGVVRVALVSRRRAIVARILEWARRKGARFEPEPTPGQVKRALARDAATARWAEAVEEGAFGSAEVDARVEAEIDRLGHEIDGERRPP